MKPYTFEPRPFSFSDLITKTFSLYMNALPLFAGLYLLFYFFPLVLLTGTFSSLLHVDLSSQTSADSDYLSLITFGLSWILGAILAGAGSFYLGARKYLGAEVSLLEVLQAAWPRLFSLLIAGCLYFLMVLSGIALCALLIYLVLTHDAMVALLLGIVLVPAALSLSAYFYVRFGLVFCVVMLEEKGAFQALRRSSVLTKGYRFRFLGITLVMMLFISILGLPGTMVNGLLSALGLPFVGFLGNQGWNALLQPLSSLWIVLFYFDQRIRKEDFDLYVLAESLDLNLPQALGARPQNG